MTSSESPASHRCDAALEEHKKAKMKNEELAQEIRRSHWMVIIPDPSNYSDNETLRYVEPLIHEICHALSLGITIDKNAPDKISDFFDKVNGQSRALGLVHEAHAFAIESRVLRFLGWDRHFHLSALMKDIHQTGYSGPALPFKTFQSVFRAISREARTIGHAKTAIRSLYGIAKMPLPDRSGL